MAHGKKDLLSAREYWTLVNESPTLPNQISRPGSTTPEIEEGDGDG
jgi:hypothetical protein